VSIRDIGFVYFGLHGVLIDSVRLREQYPKQVARVLAQTYGDLVDWEAAYRQVALDWDSYYADLDLAGQNGVDHLWEGMFRTTRAIFRQAGMPEPPKSELTRLARSLPGRASSGCEAAYSDVRQTLASLRRRGIRLGAFAAMSSGQMRGLLDGARIRSWFMPHALLGIDTIERFHHDADYWQLATNRAHAPKEAILVVDMHTNVLGAAQSIGMRAVRINRVGDADSKDMASVRTLAGLTEWILPEHPTFPSRRTTP